jgi:indole-3-glycerol phosphate synthase
MTILDQIIAYKKDEVALAKASTPLAAIEALARSTPPPRGFENALRRKAASGFALIAEIKKASPSKGVIRPDFNPGALARAYERGGAACLSVLTDGPGFQGSPADLKIVRQTVSLPIIRKDFMIDPYQVTEARAWGADCILLILAALSEAQAVDLAGAAAALDLDVVFEAHDEAEVERAVRLGARMIGVNNRDLRTFKTSLDTTARLAALVPSERLLISESGIADHGDLVRLAGDGAKAFLVGESLMREADVEAATKRMLSPPHFA